MKFVTNRISTGKVKSFDDIIKDYQQVKIAASQASVKTAEADEAESSGQLDVEPLHQTGESTTMPKAGPSAKKEGNEGGKSAKSKANPEEEGKDSGGPKAEGSEALTNDPKVEEDTKGGSSNKGTKKAAIEDLPQAVQDKIKGKKEDTDETDKDAKVEEDDKEEKKASSCCETCEDDPCSCKDSKCAKTEDKDDEEKEAKTEDKDDEEKEAKTEDKDDEEKEAKTEDKDDEEKEAKTEEDEEEKKEASVKFVKIANLNAKNKGFLREYWTKLYGEDYVSALLADK